MNLRKKIIHVAVLGFLALAVRSGAEDQWQEYPTKHFVIYHRGPDQGLIRAIEEWAEKFYGDIIRDLGFSRFMDQAEAAKIAIYLYRDQEGYLASGRQEEWSQGVAYFRQRQIRTFPSAYGFFDSVLPHELGHIVFRDMIGAKTAIPLWLDEGVAMFQEKAKRWGAHKIVKRAVHDGTFIPLQRLSQTFLGPQTPRENVELFYAESASVVYYMIQELGEHRFVKMCRYLKDGEPFLSAMAKAYGRYRGLGDLERGWLVYLETQ